MAILPAFTPLELGGQYVSQDAYRLMFFGGRAFNIQNPAGSAQQLPTPAQARINDFTLNTDCTITPPADSPTQIVDIIIRQDAKGGHSTFFPGVIWANSAAYITSPAANAIDRVTLYCDGNRQWIGSIVSTTSGAGTQGPAGPAGAPGATGPTGPAGSVNSVTTQEQAIALANTYQTVVTLATPFTTGMYLCMIEFDVSSGTPTGGVQVTYHNANGAITNTITPVGTTLATGTNDSLDSYISAHTGTSILLQAQASATTNITVSGSILGPL